MSLRNLGVTDCSEVPCWLHYPITCLSNKWIAVSLVGDDSSWWQVSGQQACSHITQWYQISWWLWTTMECLNRKGLDIAPALLKICVKKGGQLVSADFEAEGTHDLWTWCLYSLLSPTSSQVLGIDVDGVSVGRGGKQGVLNGEGKGW